jgi:hypothetical protein
VSDKIECTLDEWLANGPAICRGRDLKPEELVITDKEPMWHCSGTTKATHFWPEPGQETMVVSYQRNGKRYPPEGPTLKLLVSHDLPQSIYDGLLVRWYRSKEEGNLVLSQYLIDWAKRQLETKEPNVID